MGIRGALRTRTRVRMARPSARPASEQRSGDAARKGLTMTAPEIRFEVVGDENLLELDRRASACLEACDVSAAEYPHLRALQVAAAEAFALASAISAEISRRLAREVAEFLDGRA
jgi:hypothetical protein